MPIQNISLSFSNINISAQVGDAVYWTPPSNGGGMTGGFNTSELVNTAYLGVITTINSNNIIVEYNDDPPHQGVPPIGSFISFAKDKSINTSSLLGYYASVKFVNNSKKTNVELFSIRAEVSQSSK